MKIAYVELDDNLEQNLLKAYANRDNGLVDVAGQKLLYPVIVNFSRAKFEVAQDILSTTNYREVRYFHVDSAELLYERIKERLLSILLAASKADLNIIIVYESKMNLTNIKGAIKLCMKRG